MYPFSKNGQRYEKYRFCLFVCKIISFFVISKIAPLHQVIFQGCFEWKYEIKVKKTF